MQKFIQISQQQIFQSGEVDAISLQGDSLVNHIRKLENEKEKQMTAISGLKCLEQLEKFSQPGSLAKMFLVCLIGEGEWYSQRSRLTWKLRGLKYSHLLYCQLVVKTAPHRRDRLWVVAYAAGNTGNNGIGNEGQNAQSLSEKRFNESEFIAHSGKIRLSDKEQIRKMERGFGSGKCNEYNTWQEFPTQPPVCGGNDGICNRVDRIRALGNAIVPQVAYEIFKSIEQLNRCMK